MIDDPKQGKGVYDFVESIKETSILKHFDKPKPDTETLKRKDFLFCEPPEVILQSKQKKNILTIKKITLKYMKDISL